MPDRPRLGARGHLLGTDCDQISWVGRRAPHFAPGLWKGVASALRTSACRITPRPAGPSVPTIPPADSPVFQRPANTDSALTRSDGLSLEGEVAAGTKANRASEKRRTRHRFPMTSRPACFR